MLYIYPIFSIFIFLCIDKIHLQNSIHSCGLKLDEVTKALTGEDKPTLAPWTVSLGSGEDETYHSHLCTGTIIKDDVVITAAHCVMNRRFDEDTIVVLAGVLDLRFRGGVTRKIKETHVHPKYKEPTVYYDVALLILEKPLKFSSSISPICLPTSALSSLPDSMVGLATTVQGWGTNNDGQTGKLLTQIDVSVRSNEECNFIYNSSSLSRLDEARIGAFLPNLLIDSMYCADRDCPYTKKVFDTVKNIFN